LAGFSNDDIEIEIVEGHLAVRSLKENIESEGTIHRGISYRKFDRKFTLADDIIVKEASLENGMLKIYLERIVPDEKKPRIITIK
jgi:molecular chaperone IbpA